MGRVFVSHSAKDANGRTFLQSLFGSVPDTAYFYSWEGPEPPHALTLRDRIAESDSLFVLLSPRLDSSFTVAWVSCEVGMALALSKPVWVLERLIGLGATVTRVPVPGLTGYLERPSTLPNRRVEPYASLVESAGVGVPVGPDGREVQQIVCPNRECRAT